MGRVTDPLALFGAQSFGRTGGRLPLTMIGAVSPVPVRYTLPMPSAQVKSAVLLAGLNAPGQTVVIEPEATRPIYSGLLGWVFLSVILVLQLAGGLMIKKIVTIDI